MRSSRVRRWKSPRNASNGSEKLAVELIALARDVFPSRVERGLGRAELLGERRLERREVALVAPLVGFKLHPRLGELRARWERRGTGVMSVELAKNASTRGRRDAHLRLSQREPCGSPRAARRARRRPSPRAGDCPSRPTREDHKGGVPLSAKTSEESATQREASRGERILFPGTPSRAVEPSTRLLWIRSSLDSSRVFVVNVLGSREPSARPFAASDSPFAVGPIVSRGATSFARERSTRDFILGSRHPPTPPPR